MEVRRWWTWILFDFSDNSSSACLVEIPLNSVEIKLQFPQKNFIVFTDGFVQVFLVVS